MIVHSSRASPQIRLPAANMTLLNTSPGPRPKMSVSRPESGWQLALAIRYAVASQDISVSDWNSDEIGAESVAMMEASMAPRKTPTHVVRRVRIRRRSESSSERRVMEPVEVVDEDMLCVSESSSSLLVW
ncbi:hypothetical protein QBC47DRAFT_367879 [Echria macrotheca]|uniref:Uncharacterized protein n=1 Tax=Echria macrotheca TaxID=438768 RepID=A0AAJ0FB21_9PEZI|nr:hypothetical protein QBC47DRAFT_367879 [Echria macrotheca]